MLVYYGTSIFIVPTLSQFVLDQLQAKVDPGGFVFKALEHLVQSLLFFMILPLFWDRVDKSATMEAQKSSRELARQNSGLGFDEETEMAAAAVAASANAYKRRRKFF